MQLLKQLTSIHAPSGEEVVLKEFLIKYIRNNYENWLCKPELIYGKKFQDCLLVKFGKPKVAVFCHMDSVGFNVKYGRELIKIGSPVVKEDFILTGTDSRGQIECKIKVDEETNKMYYVARREIDRGTSLVYKHNFKESDNYIESCYLDNRLGIWVMLKLMETLENGIIVFTCWEEIGGGSASYLAKYIYEQLNINKALIADITWVTGGISHGNGVVISQRDKSIPRKSFFEQVKKLAKENNIKFQIEVENAGGSDGSEIQKAPYPIDWLFIGAPEDGVHSPNEKVHKNDVKSMLEIYKLLLKKCR
ncbi:MAG: M42 family metallopeptidase [Marinilabiliales bacterium]